MNAKLVDRLAELEARAIRQLSDADLERLAYGEHGEFGWMRELTDAELDQCIAGGPVPTRFANRIRD